MKNDSIILFFIGIGLIAIARLTYPIFGMDWFVIAYGAISAVCISLAAFLWISGIRKKGGEK